MIELGRPRDSDITSRVVEAAKGQFLAGGLAGVRYETLATLAGTSRTAIYRRWPTKIALALDVIESSVNPGVHPHTGAVLDDLTQHAMQNVTNQRPVGELAASPRGLWSMILSPEVVEGYMQRVGNSRRLIGRSIIQDGIDRGELPSNVDGDLILDTIAGLTLFKNVVSADQISIENVRAVAKALCEHPPRTATT